MFEWGQSYASYLVGEGNENGEYKPGTIFENLDELENGQAVVVTMRRDLGLVI